ncbi:DKNYY domain-containing protein [Pseudomonas sp. B21-028]|uniref:DKNYY domain-containing protein n=1 Tax=Pseudomonas sp. B21-028 TaxID=2895480 RepID=UPI0021604CC3|nr:DKNYY domain-containing protein [Pseudomonas sp. B21-028]UVL83343.1 DKNYY domain-containing protein [Pseudomonas sp. B21-028]
MTRIRYVAATWLLSCHLAQACSPAPVEQQYALVNGQLVYQWVTAGRAGAMEATLINNVEGVDVSRFHLASPHTPVQTDNTGPWRDGGPLQRPSYYTDGHNVYYKGTQLQNPAGTPAVHAASFVQPFAGMTFAADNESLYYDGERTDNNTTAAPLDIASLKVVDEYLLMDIRNLYHRGKIVGSAKGFRIIASKPYGSGSSCRQGKHVIARNNKTVFLDGVAINADATTFRVKRWEPDTVLDYVDKHGSHTYSYK